MAVHLRHTCTKGAQPWLFTFDTDTPDNHCGAWQDPDNPKKRIYKVFDKIEDVRIDEESTGHQVLGPAKVAPNKAVRASLESGLTAKAASSSGGDMDLWGGLGFMEKPKKNPNTRPKKEKTPEELEKKQFDTDLAKILGFNT